MADGFVISNLTTQEDAFEEVSTRACDGCRVLSFHTDPLLPTLATGR